MKEKFSSSGQASSGHRRKPYGTSLAIFDADFSTLVNKRLLSSSLALISSSFWFMVSMRWFNRLKHPQARNKMGNMSNVFMGSLPPVVSTLRKRELYCKTARMMDGIRTKEVNR